MDDRRIFKVEHQKLRHQKIEAYSFKSFGFTLAFLAFLIEALHYSHNKMVPSLTIDIAITAFLRGRQILHQHSDFLILG
jgi:hypothetical protein